MGGRSSKVKGAGYEREIVNWHRGLGVPARRTPLSGALKGDLGGDLMLGPALGMKAECKRRKRGFGSLYAALEQDGCDLLFVRDDHQHSLVVMPLETWTLMLRWLGWAAAAEGMPAKPAEEGED